MALITNRDSNPARSGIAKLPVCHTCRERKVGLFTQGPNGHPECADCARNRGQAIPGS